MVTMVSPYEINSYTVVVHEAEEGGFWGEVLELPGCVSQGENLDEFRRNIREALEVVLSSEASESVSPTIRVYQVPDIADKDCIEYGIPETVETWTATG